MLKISHPLMRILAIVLSILLIPFVAMQFTTEVNWSIFDFLVAGILLFVAGIAFYLIIKKLKTIHLKVIASIFLFLAFCLVWAELAVGIFGTPLAGN